MLAICLATSDHDDHLRYLQRCEEGHIHSTVLTPYLNFMYGGRITYLIAILEHGGYNVLPDSNGLVYVLDAPWRERIDRFDSVVVVVEAAARPKVRAKARASTRTKASISLTKPSEIEEQGSRSCPQ